MVYAGQQLRVREGDLTTSLVPVQAAAPQSSAPDSGQSAPVQSYQVTPASAPAPCSEHGGYRQLRRLGRRLKRSE